MKSHFACASIGLFALVTAVACRDASPPAAPRVAADLTGPPTIQHFVSNGPLANANWFGSDAAGVVTYGFVAVNRGDVVTNPQTFLSYDIVQCTPPGYFCTEIEAGYGTIPNGDFTGGGKRMRLVTNTSDNPSVARFVGNGGSITVDWEVNGIFSYEQQGVTSTTMPGDTLVPGSTRTTFRQQGSFSSLSANARGNVFGQDLPLDAYGGMGTAHNVTIEITR
jgi:hypothetical protein